MGAPDHVTDLTVDRAALDALPCPVCESRRAREYLVKEGRPILICGVCRHLFWSVMPTPEQATAFYASDYTSEHQAPALDSATIAYYRGHVAELCALADRRANQLILADIGCSYPVLLQQAMLAGAAKVWGVDWSREATEYGRNSGVPMCTPPEFETQCPDGSLDVLRYSHVLEHLENPLQILWRHVRKLRPGGVVYITQPNVPVLRADASGVELMDSVWPNHLHFFNPLSLRVMVERCGLTIERFFTLVGEEAALEKFGALLDQDYVEARLAGWPSLGEASRGSLNNYPLYTGENSVLHARRPS